jgi:hypothetical protein
MICDDSFGDLRLNDLISTHKRIARRHLRCLEIDPAFKGLLERGSLPTMEGIESSCPQIEVSIGYAAAVGTNLAYQIAGLHQSVGEVVVHQFSDNTDFPFLVPHLGFLNR